MRRPTALLVGLCLHWGAPALGQKADDDVASARAKVAEATRLAREGDWAAGLVRFREAQQHADALGDPAGLQWNIARCLEELGRNEEAIEAFEAYLAMPDSQAGHAEARTRIAGMVRTTYGFVDVQCGGVRATVGIRGDAHSFACPHRFRLRPGRYQIVARTDDGRQSSASAAVALGEPSTVALLLPTTRAGGDSEEGGRASETKGTGARLLPWFVVGGAAALAGAGTGFLVSAEGAFSDAEAAGRRYNAARDPNELASARREVESDLESGRLYRGLGYGLLAAGAVTAGVATWLFITHEPSGGTGPEDASLALAPQRSGAAVVWSGRW